MVRDGLYYGLFHHLISMAHLLPCYPAMREKLAQDEKEGHIFDALELFFCHFLREGSVFASFGFEHLHEQQILTELHFHDIHKQHRSMSEDLDLLDEAIAELEEHDTRGPSDPITYEPLRSQLHAAIQQRDSLAVGTVLRMGLGRVDGGTLCFAIRQYEPTVFHLLLKHGAQVDGGTGSRESLFLAAEAGHLDAVRLLIHYGATLGESTSPIDRTLGLAQILRGRSFLKHHRDNLHYPLKAEGSDSLEFEDWVFKTAPLKSGPRLPPIANIAVKIGSAFDSAATDMENCPAVAAVRAQGRKSMARRLLAKVASSRDKLLDASVKMTASARLTAFVGQVGSSSSVWGSGTRAIRDISEGYKPFGLSDIINALQVANAMRSAVPRSKRACPRKELARQNRLCSYRIALLADDLQIC